MKKTLKSIKKIFEAPELLEGAGFLVHRGIGVQELKNLDPFLMLDEMGPTKYGPGEAKGAPNHPHRGFETVTYMLSGEMEHQDSMGNKEQLRAGDCQWMTAGAGIIHDESPSKAMMEKGGTMHGFQLWVNLPRKLKMCQPHYQGLSSNDIPKAEFEGGFVKVIAGEVLDKKAKINTEVPIQYLDVHLEKKDAKFSHKIPIGHNSFLFVYSGSIGINSKIVKKHHMVVFEKEEDSEGIEFTGNEENTKVLVLSGKPINEPIVQYGPFVMNTQREIYEAFQDYQEGNFAAKPKISSQATHDKEYDPTQ
eukprot:gene9072-1167_t